MPPLGKYKLKQFIKLTELKPPEARENAPLHLRGQPRRSAMEEVSFGYQ
jgi:hypothetical protein